MQVQPLLQLDLNLRRDSEVDFIFIGLLGVIRMAAFEDLLVLYCIFHAEVGGETVE